MIKKIIIAVCILSMVGMLVWKFGESGREEKAELKRNAEISQAEKELLLASSDAKVFDRTVQIYGDSWMGYMIFRSRLFQEAMAKQNLGVKYHDEPDFQKRYAALANGSCDFALGTIDSYLLNGQSSNYPGVISLVIDESYGGDAVISRGSLKSMDDLRSGEIKGAFVGYSPSEFFLKSQISHFGLEVLGQNISSFRVDEDQKAFQALKQGKVDFAVLWEPYVSRALKEIPNATKLLDSSRVKNLIVDVGIASRQLVVREPQVLEKVTEAYFSSLKNLLNDESLMLKLAQADSGLTQDATKQTLSGIRFANYGSNTQQWFPVSGTSNRTAQSISGIQRILLDIGDLSSMTDPSQLMSSRTLQRLAGNSKTHGMLMAGASGRIGQLGSYFSSLGEKEWEALVKKATGTLLEKPITFASGSFEIPEEFQEDLLQATSKLEHYPYHRLIIQAHVSKGQDPVIDQELSDERAKAIKDFLIRNTSIQENRIHAQGRGAKELLTRRANESSRAWKRRLRRARILIAAD